MPPSLDAGFRFDGTSSDLAQQFYRRFLANDTAAPLSVATTPLPEAILARLTAVNVAFRDLPGLLQRALVWDSGFAVTPRNELVRVQTLHGVSMAELAVSKADYINAAKCTAQNCTQIDGTEWFKSDQCNGAQMTAVARCLVDDFDGGGEIHLSMWSTGGDDTAIPEMRVLKHVWTDANVSYAVSAIHTAKSGQEPAYGNCVGAGDEFKFARGVGSLVIPCSPRETITDEMQQLMRPPAPGQLVTAWLEQYGSANRQRTTPSTGSERGLDPLLLLPIGGLVVLLIVLGVIWRYRRRPRAKEQPPVTVAGDGDPSIIASPQYPFGKLAETGAAEARDTSGSSRRFTQSTTGGGSLYSAEDYDSGASNSVMQILLGDPHVSDKQLVYDHLQFGSLVCRGAYGEVWVGSLHHEVVALKRLLRGQPQSFDAVETFAHEIQLSASLDHPNIVHFVGVAWNSLENLVMVMEYLPRGDLTNVLRTNGPQLSWDQHKLAMARGLASAVAYMHSQRPEVIHRDLKSKNVLLSDGFEPKLIDFGVSRRKKDRTMTAGVGTPFWTAPEVLEGTRYTEKSDIYSLGVLLTELDTCELPYCDARGENGEKLKHFQVLNLVMGGQLRPGLRGDCPDRIRKVVDGCLDQDPEKRPTATDLLSMLA